MQLKQEIEKLKDQNRLLKEKLEYFTDKYGLPDSWNVEEFNNISKTDTVNNEIPQAPVNNNVISMDEKHQQLVVKSLTELLKVQLSDLLETLATQNRQNVNAYNAILGLKDKLREFDK